jgi:hypothetical protein
VSPSSSWVGDRWRGKQIDVLRQSDDGSDLLAAQMVSRDPKADPHDVGAEGLRLPEPGDLLKHAQEDLLAQIDRIG